METGSLCVVAVPGRYVAVYPVYLTRQRSREQREVYDDEDLQIFYEDLDEGVLDKGVLGQGKKMLSRDSAILFLAVFIICIIQREETLLEPVSFSIFNIVFEVIRSVSGEASSRKLHVEIRLDLQGIVTTRGIRVPCCRVTQGSFTDAAGPFAHLPLPVLWKG